MFFKRCKRKLDLRPPSWLNLFEVRAGGFWIITVSSYIGPVQTEAEKCPSGEQDVMGKRVRRSMNPIIREVFLAHVWNTHQHCVVRTSFKQWRLQWDCCVVFGSFFLALRGEIFSLVYGHIISFYWFRKLICDWWPLLKGCVLWSPFYTTQHVRHLHHPSIEYKPRKRDSMSLCGEMKLCVWHSRLNYKTAASSCARPVKMSSQLFTQTQSFQSNWDTKGQQTKCCYKAGLVNAINHRFL